MQAKLHTWQDVTVQVGMSWLAVTSTASPWVCQQCAVRSNSVLALTFGYRASTGVLRCCMLIFSNGVYTVTECSVPETGLHVVPQLVMKAIWVGAGHEVQMHVIDDPGSLLICPAVLTQPFCHSQ